MTPRLVCFDLGGVIVRICRSFDQAAHAAGLDLRLSTADLDRSRAQRRALTDLHQTGGLDSADYYDRISASLARAYSPDEVRRIHDAWILGEYSGVHDLVSDLLARPGIRTGVLSNTNDAHWHAMTASRRDLFPTPARVHHPHASHLLRLGKPAPAIYEAFELAADAAPSDIVFFDDLPENIDAARARGWLAHRIDPDADTASQMRAHLARAGVLPF